MNVSIAKVENGFTINTWNNSTGGRDITFVFSTMGEALDKVAELLTTPTPVVATDVQTETNSAIATTE